MSNFHKDLNTSVSKTDILCLCFGYFSMNIKACFLHISTYVYSPMRWIRKTSICFCSRPSCQFLEHTVTHQSQRNDSLRHALNETALYLCMCATHRSFIANGTLDHMLVDLALHRNGVLTHPAGDNGGAATLRRGQRGIGWRVLPQEHQRLGSAWKRRKTCTSSMVVGRQERDKQTNIWEL